MSRRIAAAYKRDERGRWQPLPGSRRTRRPTPPLSAAIRELITAFGTARMAEFMGVRRPTPHLWCTQRVPGAGATRLLLRAAEVVGASDACVSALKTPLVEREAALAVSHYIGASAVFSTRFGWPMKPARAAEWLAQYEHLRRPEPPPPLPPGLSEQQIALLQQRFQRVGWSIIMNHEGRLVPCRSPF